MSMGEADRMDQNILSYMIDLRTKKWWRSFFRFTVDVADNNAYQIYHQSQLNPGEYRLNALVFTEALLMRSTACTERLCCLQHYPQLVTAYLNLQRIRSLTVSITGLLRAHNDGAGYQDIKELDILLQKLQLLVFMLNVLNDITYSEQSDKCT